tara:strand:+ start:123 stop:1055 length:933 start_codon:yes stop_codon:yes gene_type:complete
MDIYKIHDNKLEQIKSESFKLEKDIQRIIENNCEELFNLQFVKSEFTIQNYRIDTLCFNEEDKSFVIIEYKKGNSYSVIDQGYTYLSQMLNNKSDFVLEYNESVNSNLKRDDVDWTQSRVIFISPSFNSYQTDSVNFKDIPFELWEIKRFDNDIISLSQISSNSKESIKEVKNISSEDNKVLDEVEVYDEESVIGKSSDLIKDIYFEIKEKISSWEDINFRPAKRYITINKGKKVAIYLSFQSNRIKIVITRRIDFKGNVKDAPIKFDMDDPKKIFVLKVDDRREIYNYSLEDRKDLDYLISILKQRYDM